MDEDNDELLEFERNLAALNNNEKTMDQILVEKFGANHLPRGYTTPNHPVGNVPAGGIGSQMQQYMKPPADEKQTVILVDMNHKTGKPELISAKMSPAEWQEYEREQSDMYAKVKELRQQLKDIRKPILEERGLWTPEVEALFEKDDWDILSGEDPTRFILDPLFWQSLAHRKGYCREKHPDGKCPMDLLIEENQKKQRETMADMQRLAAEVESDRSLCGLVRRGDMSNLTRVLSMGVDPDSRDKDGNTGIHWAALQGRYDILDLIISHAAGSRYGRVDGGADPHQLSTEDTRDGVVMYKGNVFVDLANSKQETALHWAVHRGDLAMAKYLIRRGAALDTRTGLGMGMLHKAAQRGHVHMLEWLYIVCGDTWNINSIDAHCKTPLHWAVYGGHTHAAEWLLQRGANPFMCDDEDACAVHWAAIKGYSETLDSLCEQLSSLSSATVQTLRIAADKSRETAMRARHGNTRPESSYMGENSETSLSVCDALGLSSDGLALLLQRDNTKQDVLALAMARAGKAANGMERKRADDLVKLVRKWVLQYQNGRQFFGLRGVLQKAGNTVWANGLVLLTFLSYISIIWVYISFIQRHTYDYFGYWPGIFTHALILTSMFWWRLAAFSDPGYVTEGDVGDDMWYFQRLPAKLQLSTITRAYKRSQGDESSSVVVNVDNTDAEDEDGLLSTCDGKAPSSAPDLYNIMTRAEATGLTTHHALRGAYEGYIHGEEGKAPPVCVTCRIERPLRAKHCRVCKRCVTRFDHHCPFINNCVGGGNYRAFMIWLMTILVIALIYHPQLILALRLAHPHMTLGAAICYHWQMSLWAGFLFLYLLALTPLLRYHIPLVLTNLTTNEVMNKNRYQHLKDDNGEFHNPFSRGAVDNLKFCLGLGPEESCFALVNVCGAEVSKQTLLAHYEPTVPNKAGWGKNTSMDGRGGYAKVRGRDDDEEMVVFAGNDESDGEFV